MSWNITLRVINKSWTLSLIRSRPKFTEFGGNKYRLARPVTLPIFVPLRQEVYEIAAVENFCSRKSGPWPNFTKIADLLLRTNAPHRTKFHRTWPNDVRSRKALQFLHSVFWRPGVPPTKVHKIRGTSANWPDP